MTIDPKSSGYILNGNAFQQILRIRIFPDVIEVKEVIHFFVHIQFCKNFL